MCDLFQANPWKPLLCTNCHQNRSGHKSNDNKNEHLPPSTSSIHLYEEIMAQYFTINSIEQNENIIVDDNDDEEEEDSFSDEEQDLPKPSSTIEIIPNQSMINTQGIVLIGPDLPSTKEILTKKTKKLNLLKKSKSNADECLKKTEMMEANTSKLWWFKAKKANTSLVTPTDITNDSNKINNQIQQQKIRVLPETNKLTLNEALNIARRQHSLPSREPKLTINTKPFRSPGISTYSSSIGSTTSSSTHSGNEYDIGLLNNSTKVEPTYLTAVSPVENNNHNNNNNNQSLDVMFDKINKITIERITCDLRIIIDEYKHNLPVARFQTLKSFLQQNQLSKILSHEAIYFILLQILDEYSQNSIIFDHFLIAYHSTIPIIVTTTSTITNPDESIEDFIKNLAKKLFDSSSLPIFNDLSTFENLSYRYLLNEIFQFSNFDIDNNLSIQRIKLLDLFWNKIHSLRHIQINEDNERIIFALYYLMKYQSDNSF